MATGDTPLHVYDGDIIQLYCPLESGYVYSEPNSTSDLELDIVSKDKIKIADFAAFSITLKKESTNENHSKRKGSTTAVTEKIAYGSIVSLKHQASNNVMTGKNKEVKLSSSKAAVKLSSSKAATASDDNRMPQLLFRVVSPNHELEWGEELQDNYLIKLKLISDNNSLVYFYYDHQRKFYRPTLRASGTVFNVKVYCHEYLRQNPKSIKGGSPIIISTLLNIEGYLCATGSFFSSKFDEIERTSGHEQTSGSYSRSLEEPTEQQSRIKQQSGVEQPEEYLKYSLTKEDSHKEEMKVGFIKFKGIFKKSPEYGETGTFFQLERVSEPPGSPIQFGEKCRIKHLFTLKYISVTPGEKVILCDLNESNESSLNLRILPISGSTEREACDFDKIVFQHVESSLYLSVSLRIFQQKNELFNLTLSKDSSVLQSQFKVLQVEKSLLVDCYYAIGFSSFLYDSFKMLNNGDIDKIIHKEVERKVDQIETFYEAQCESTKYRFIHMLWNLDVFIEGLSKKSPQENGGYKLCVRKKSDQEQTDCGESTLAVDLDLHIEKLLYEKSLAQPDLKKWVPLVTLVDLLKRMKESKELLTKYGILEGDIQSCIYSYDKIFVKDHSQNPKCRCYGLTKDTAIDIEMDELDRTVSCSTSPLQRLAPRPFGDDDNAIVSGFLLMLHLLFTKYVFVRSQRPANESTERNDDPNENLSKNFNKFFKDNCLNWCNILSQLIANEDYTISYMSASLLFDICMKEQIIDKNKPIFANYKENVVPMKSEELELIKKMLLMQLNEKDREDLIKFLTGFYSQDKSKPNVAVNNLKFVYNSGLFHIILEYTLKHNTYSIFYKQEVISCCFELLQGLAASSEKVRNEMFRYFLNFLQFKRVTNVMICLINEIFYGNSYLSKKLTKSDLGKIFYTAIMNGTADGHYQWTIVLQTIIENSDQVQVQEHVAQLISKHSNDYLQHILCPREQREVNWLDILKSNEEHKDECHLLLNITDLLASCASGECQYGRLVAMKLIFFDDLMEILGSGTVPMYRKLPFIRILTVTYLTEKSHFITNCSQYKELWSQIKITIDMFTPNSGNITSKSHRVIYQQIVKGGKYMQPVEDMMRQPPEQQPLEIMLYITDGIIPFLSELCQQMSHQSSIEYICTTEDLQSVGEKLATQLESYCSVSEKLVKSEFIKNINSLLTNQIDLPPLPPDNTSSTNIEDILLGRCESIEPPSNCHEKIVKLLKTKNGDDVRAVLNEVILTLKNLVILQKKDKLSCFERIDVEETISRMLILLQTVMKEVIPPSKKPLSQEKLKDLVEVVKNILYLNDFSNKEHTIFHLLQSQNNEVIFQVVELLKCFEKVPKELEAPKKVQEMMISSCEAHDNVYIVQVHRLLREAEAHIKYNTNHSQNDSTEILKSKKGFAAALDLIILLCDWQQKDMQDAMRNKGSNIVNQVSFIFFYISKHWDDTKINIAQKAVQALIEMCTGNYTNQEIAYKGQVIASINVILRIQTSYHDDNKEKRKLKYKLNRLKLSCLELLEVMLEEIDEKSSSLANRIANHLKMESLRAELKKSWKPTHSCAALRDFMCCRKKETSLVMRSYHVLRRIADYKCVSVEELVDQAEIKDGKMWKHYQEQSKSVQIVYKEYDKPDILTRVYFHNDPNIHIDLNLKDKIIRKIERFTPQEKLLNLLEWAKAVKQDNSEEKNKLRKYKVVHGMSLKTEKGRDFLLIFLTLILNLLILFTVKTPPDYNMPNGVCTVNESYNETCNNSTSSSPMYFQPILYPDIPEWSTVILTILGAIHVVLAVLMVIEYFTKKWGYITNLKDLKRQISSFLGINQHNKRSKQMPLQSKNLISASILSYQSLYRIFFLICSALALIPYPTTLKYFYCGCMLYPFMNSLAMKYILRAVRRSIIQLLTVLLLCLVITYIYAVISFALLNNYFSEDRDQFCGSIFECFVTVSHLGLLGSSLDIRPSDDYKPSFGLYLGRVVYDLVLYIVIIVLGLNIVLAILVADRFSDAKSHLDNVEKDEEKNCFICSIPRNEFQKNKKDFQKHVKEEHSIWDYIRFIIHVKDHPQNEHNALEKYVYEQVKDEDNESIDFFPLYRAKSLPHYKYQDSATEEQLRRTLQSLVVRHEVASSMKDIRKR